MEDSIEHRLSALLDGETSEFETRRLVEEINKNQNKIEDKTKTIQDLDREKLEKKFSKEDKEKLN